MGLLFIIVTFLLGVMGAAPVIVAKKPDAGELIDKLVPIQGFLGIGGVVIGIWWFLISLTGFYLVGLISGAVIALLGFLMGFSLLSKLFASSPEAAAKAQNLRLALAKFQVPLGLAAIGLAVWGLIMWIRY
jgi:hypothetical protein